ncbi:acetoacetate decarboxylase family protein [Actinocatenispora rupis]|uniref:Acetoacetate decarboxylase (ADC) n=1 Tax=Actinocatenispora rupis TaxID=519421 RepID=A0A8J3JAE0_9ACTN|nr:acetoacetate decarboxylase family protein [Actinocatenispora rupis]GID14686.1 hypothetical protein Aru02nite_55750 [Actinocatenispora rupis]
MTDEPALAPSATAMPAFAPLYAVGTETATLDWLTVVYRTDPAVVRAILPPPLTPDPDPEVLVWVARFRTAEFSAGGEVVGSLEPYTQGGVCVRCTRGDEPGAYPLVSYIAGLNHGFTGRELFGLPKKQALDVDLSTVDDEVSAGITTTRGTPVVRVAGTLGGPTDPLVPDWFATQYTLKLIPSATGVGFDVNRLVRIPFTFTDQADVRGVDATVTLAESAADPLHLLPVRSTRTAAYGSTALHVGYGTYLDEVTAIPTLGRPAG